MTTWMRAVLPVALVAVLATPLWAEDGAPPPAPPEGRAQPEARPDGPPPGGASAGLQRLTDRLGELNLTADQKVKVEALIARAAEEVKAAEKKIHERMQTFDKELQDVLTAEQQKKAAEIAGQGQGPGQAGGPGGQMLDRMRSAVEKLDLTAVQKEKLKAEFDGLRTDARELFEKHRNDPQAAREAMRELMEKARTRIHEILTPEQAKQLREAMRPADGGGGGGRQRGRGGNNPPPAN